MSKEPKTVRCTDCRTEFADAELVGAHGCPACGTASVPMSIAQDVTIRINWHELRVLTIWASNHAGAKDFPPHSRRALESTLRELDKQKPHEGFAPLTLAGEVRQLQEAGHDAEARDAEGNVIVPRMVKN